MEHFYDALWDLNETIEEQLDGRFEGLRLCALGCSNLIFLVLARIIDGLTTKWAWLLNTLADAWLCCVAFTHVVINRFTALMDTAVHCCVLTRGIILYCCNVIVSRVSEILPKSVIEWLEALALLSPTIAIVSFASQGSNRHPFSLPPVIHLYPGILERNIEPITENRVVPAAPPWVNRHHLVTFTVLFFGWPFGLACLTMLRAALQLWAHIEVFFARQWHPTVFYLVRCYKALKRFLKSISGFLYTFYVVNAVFYFYLFLVHWERGFLSRADEGTFDPLNRYYEYCIIGSILAVFGNTLVPAIQLLWRWLKRPLHHAGMFITGRVHTVPKPFFAGIVIFGVFVALWRSNCEFAHVWGKSITDAIQHDFNPIVLLFACIQYVTHFFIWIAHRLLDLHDRLERARFQDKQWLCLRRTGWIDGSVYTVAVTATVLAVRFLWRAFWNPLGSLKLCELLRAVCDACRAVFDDAMMINNAVHQPVYDGNGAVDDNKSNILNEPAVEDLEVDRFADDAANEGSEMGEGSAMGEGDGDNLVLDFEASDDEDDEQTSDQESGAGNEGDEDTTLATEVGGMIEDKVFPRAAAVHYQTPRTFEAYLPSVHAK